MNRDPQGLYTFLGITPDATAKEIISAYNKRVDEINLFGISGKAFNTIVNILENAHITLTNPRRRKLYDRQWNAIDPVDYFRARQAS